MRSEFRGKLLWGAVLTALAVIWGGETLPALTEMGGPPSTTTLKVADIVGPDTPYAWIDSRVIVSPETLTFRWSTEEAGVTSARWEVALKSSGARLASGRLASVPAKGKSQEFSILFSFIPKTPPKAPQVYTYEVRVIPADAKKERTASAPVVVTYRDPGPSTKFDFDPEPWNTPEGYLLLAAYQALKGKLGLGEPLGKMSTDGKRLKAFQRFWSLSGPACIEVYQGNKIWVCAPKSSIPNQQPPATYVWYEYKKDANGKFVPAETDPNFMDAPPDFQPSALTKSGDWTDREEFDSDDLIPGSDPPHWSPILVRNSGVKIGDIHRLMQNPTTHGQAVAMLNQARPGDVDLTDRVMDEPWQSVTLKGIVTSAGFPSGDFGIHHASDYNDGEDTPTGALASEDDPSEFPGMDWDMKVQPDRAYSYLASTARSTLQVEIEHFALFPWPQQYWPQTGEWLQTIGRWVVDSGHAEPPDDEVNGFYTEIHPPEMLVSSTTNNHSTEARVIVTGAWRGKDLHFVVNPPPRPKPTAELKYRISRANGMEGYDRRDGADLTVEKAGDPASPNHLRCKVKMTSNPGVILRYETGMVGMTRHRGLECMVTTWWDVPAEPVTVKGILKSGNVPAQGAYLFYRTAEAEGSKWKRVAVDASGNYTLSGLIKGAYWFRPAGSGWSFHEGPTRVKILGGVNRLDFSATRLERPTQRLSVAVRSNLATTLRANKPQLQALPSLDEAALRKLRSMLVTTKEPTNNFGVKGNALGYAEGGTFLVNLVGLLGENDKPVTDLKSAYRRQLVILGRGTGDLVQILGTPGPGVSGAKIRARLLLGNETVGYQVAQEVQTLTDSHGNARFRFKAGSHVEEARLSVQVLENPVNPWFLPTIWSDVHLFQPAKTGGDPKSASNDLPYQLAHEPIRYVSLSAGRLSSSDADAKSLLDRTAERKRIVRVSSGIHVVSRNSKPEEVTAKMRARRRIQSAVEER